MAFFKRAEPAPQQPEQDQGGKEVTASDLLVTRKLFGQGVSRESAMTIPAVASCVGVIAGTISALPVKLYKCSDDAVREVRGDYRCAMLNGQTGDTMNGAQMKYAMAEDYLLSDNGGHIYISAYARRNRIKALRYIQSDSCACVPVGQDQIVFKEKAYMAGAMNIPAFRMVHLLRRSHDGMSGTSVVTQNGPALSVVIKALAYQNDMLAGNGIRSGFFKSAKKLGKTALEELKKAITVFFESNGQNALILNDGLDFQEVSSLPADLQITQILDWCEKSVNAMFLVPEQIIKAGGTEGAGSVARENFTRFCIMPIVSDFEAELNEKLLFEDEKGRYFFKFDLYELTKGNALERWQVHQIEKTTGVRPVDEIRREENLEPLGIDYVTLGLQDVLFNPKTGEMIVPNMGITANAGDLQGSANAAQAGKDGTEAVAEGGEEDESRD